MEKTINKNDEFELTIDTMTNECSGLGRYDGKVVFVPFTAIGDKITAKALKVNKNIIYAKSLRINQPSSDRISSDCPVYGICGGCRLRHISYEAELRMKALFISDAFTRLGHLSPEFLPVIPNENPNGYRNKVQYPLGKDRENKAVYGYYAGHSHRIVPHKKCFLQPDIFNDIAGFIQDYIREKRLSVYNEEQKIGVLRHICIRKGHYTDEVNVCLVAKRRIPELLPLAKAIREKFPAVKGVVLNINSADTNVIMGNTEFLLAGETDIKDKMCGLDIRISPRSFYQVNTAQAERLYAIAKEFAQPNGKTIIDLYCGAGIIGMSMAKEAKEIIGIEIVPQAIENAKETAKANNIDNISFICADAAEATTKLTEQGKTADVVILDPARKGSDNITLDNIVKMKPERIVMVSCNPSTAARDCAYLCGQGYECVKVQGVDMFSRTEHVESVVLMSRVK